MSVNRVKTAMLAAGLILALVLPAARSQAANWLQLQGTESPKTQTPVNVWGLLQPTYYSSKDDVNDADSFRKNDFNIRRARVGIRGFVPNTDRKIDYFLMVEMGRNGITENPDGAQSSFAALTDASVTLNYIKGARLRVGQFKLPIGNEGLQGISAMPYVEYSDVYDQLMMERFGKDRSTSAFRDIGAEVFDWLDFGPAKNYEFSYALMVSNGAGIDSQDNDGNKDYTGKLTIARIFDHSKGPNRQEIQFGAWYMTGKRTGYTFSGGQNGALTEQNRIRYGLELICNKDFGDKGAGRLTAESVWGRGWIYAPGYFNGAVPAAERFFTEDTSVSGHGVPHANLYAHGWYVDAGYRPPVLSKKIELDVRYSYYNPDAGDDLTEDVAQHTLTLGGQYFFTPQARATLNCDIRHSDWDSTVDNRLMAQVTVIFK